MDAFAGQRDIIIAMFFDQELPSTGPKRLEARDHARLFLPTLVTDFQPWKLDANSQCSRVTLLYYSPLVHQIDHSTPLPFHTPLPLST